jgi:putative hemolysin
MVHPRLQTALLPQELLNKRNSTIRVEVGRFIPADRLALFNSDSALIRYLRLRVDTLGCRVPQQNQPMPPSRFRMDLNRFKKPTPLEPIAPPAPANALRADIATLGSAQSILTHGNLQVMFAEAAQIPNLLAEIGRLREMTFRGVGEGTGHSRDLDDFDSHYLHLFIWNDKTAEIVGAYRMGPTDRILARFGIQGLYTSTLFKFRQPLIEHLTPALELGRSFVRPEYQRGYLPLLLLWKGVAQYIVQNPHYRKLFGPVSISNSYQPASRHLIQRHLPHRTHTPELASWVRPRQPLRANRHLRLPHLPAELEGHLQTLTDLIEDLEHGQSLPVLLRHYLKLGGEVISFNVDPAFNSALDALIVVDLVKAGEAALGRYMGTEGWARFNAWVAPEVKK